MRVPVAGVLAAGLALLHAQIQNPIKAAKDAYNKAKQQAQQQQQAQPGSGQAQAPPGQPQQARMSQNQAGSPSGSAQIGPECCTADAMKKVADSLGFVDIVGIKLGMTAEQAVAAIKAFNPKMKIEIVHSRLESPDAPGFARVPRYVVAHTVGVPRYPNTPPPYTLPDGSADEIVLEFTIPPSPPLVGKIVRQVTFATGQPVVASNLVDALRKKYGQENFSDGSSRHWVFDSSGQLMARPLDRAEKNCLPSGPFDGFGWGGGGLMPGGDLSGDAPGPVNLQTTTLNPNDANFSVERAPACRPFTIVETYGLGEGTPLNQNKINMTVTLQSPALLYASRRATHDWLQAKADAKQKQFDDAAKARSAPKL